MSRRRRIAGYRTSAKVMTSLQKEIAKHVKQSKKIAKACSKAGKLGSSAHKACLVKQWKKVKG